MSIALALAARGRGAVEPNPMVGAVLVRDGAEFGRGWHRGFGGPHAEIEALAAARQAGADARGATMYVTLEPCCSHGKTPPCTDALVSAGISRVVAAMEDPDHQVSGAGFRKLRQAGVETTVGICQAEARSLLAPYVKLRVRRRPWVICKWAQTADGYLSLPPAEGRWITDKQARDHVHQCRGLCDGILVGIETVLADDPLLTNRTGRGKQPVRVVLDTRLRTPPDSRIVRAASQSPVILAATAPPDAEQLRLAGVDILDLPPGCGGVDLPALLDELGRRQWTYLLVEGGPMVLRSFLSAGLADELMVYVSPRSLGMASGLPRFDLSAVRETFALRQTDERQFGRDTLFRCLLDNQPPGN